MDKITMLVGQEGPAVSRVRGQVLTIGTDVDAAEAQRLVDADFALEGDASTDAPSPAAAPPATRRRGRAA